MVGTRVLRGIGNYSRPENMSGCRYVFNQDLNVSGIWKDAGKSDIEEKTEKDYVVLDIITVDIWY